MIYECINRDEPNAPVLGMLQCGANRLADPEIFLDIRHG
jgi:hypothetical protein